MTEVLTPTEWSDEDRPKEVTFEIKYTDELEQFNERYKAGDTIYCTENNKLYLYKGSNWFGKEAYTIIHAGVFRMKIDNKETLLYMEYRRPKNKKVKREETR